MSRLRQNILVLFAVQAANFLVPLITVPFLARSLGLKSYGELALVQAIAMYLNVLVDYGFSWSATSKIAKNQTDQFAVRKIFFSNWILQWLITALVLLAYTSWVLLQLNGDLRPLYIAGLLLILGNTACPMWYFQGLEMLGTPATIQVLGRLLSLPLIYATTHHADDNLPALLCIGGTQCLASIVVLIWAKRAGILRYTLITRGDVKSAATEGAELFISRAAVSSYTALNPLILGMMSSSEQVAFFTLAERLRSAVTAMLSPISKALFPRMSSLYATDRAAATHLLFRSALWTGTITALLGACLAFGSDALVRLFGGERFAPAADILRLMSALPFLVAISTVAGTQAMIPNGHKKVFNLIIVAASILSLSLVFVMSAHFGGFGCAATLVLTELFVTVSMGLFVFRKGYLSPLVK